MKRIRLIILLCFIGIFCSACDGDVTRDIRHDGFTYGNEFVCKYFFPSSKDDSSYLKIKYITGNHIIDENGKIYEISLGQEYSNGENCREANTNIKVKSIMDSSIIKGDDNKYYYLTSDNNVTQYSEVTNSDNNYDIYDLLLKEEDVVKVVTGDSSTGLYYVLKNDGNVYGYLVSRADRNSPPTITSSAIAYNLANYGGNIIDFNYSGNSSSTYVKSSAGLYRMYVTNGDDCNKYADVSCNYEMREDTTFNKYSDRIVAYNGNILITDYKRIFNISN